MLRSTWSPAALLLVLLMALGSVIMWLGVPFGLIYLASQIAGSSSPTLGPYLLVFIGLPVGMAIIGKLPRLPGPRAQPAHRPRDDTRRSAAWLRSMRGERTSTRRGGVLDMVMIVSVGFAVVAFAIWFFAFAGSSLPTN